MGRNGSGKSLFLRCLRDPEPDSFHYIAPERAGQFNFSSAHVENQMTGRTRATASNSNIVTEYHNSVASRIQVYLNIRGAYQADHATPIPPKELESFMPELMPDFDVRIFNQELSRPLRITRVNPPVNINQDPLHTFMTFSSGE